jgi:TolB-like protein/tetratricopeptide (TPR) repeat protein
MSFFKELKRRNVIRAAIAYAIVAWILIEITSTVFPILNLPEWTVTLVTALLLIGFPVALIFAWAFEMTPEGIKRESEVDRSESVTHVTGRRLDFVIIGVLAIAVAVFAIDKFVLNSDMPSVGSESQPSIAVLPFVDMSPNKDQEYFSDGISEELLNQLTKLRGLHVAGRTSSFSFKGKDDDLRVIAEKLNVAHILEGSVRKAGDRVRITVQLVKASDGYHLWSQTYDRDLNDIFAIQEETAKAVADALSITLGVGDAALNTGSTRNFEAYDAMLAARSLMLQQGRENFSRAIQLLEKAVRLDPDYADGWSQLSSAYGIAGALFISDRAEEFLPKAEQAAARAAEIAPKGLTSLRVMAQQNVLKNNLIEVERNLKLALGVAPTAFNVNLSYGNFLRSVGRAGEAIRYLKEAVKIEPLSLTPSLSLALTHQVNGDADLALKEFERAKSLIGDHALLNGSIIVFAMENGDRALFEEYQDAVENDPNSLPMAVSFTKMIRAVADSPEAAREELHRLYLDPAYADPLSQGVIASYAPYFGDHELALRIFRELSEQGVLFTDQIWRPNFRGVRHLPGFKEIVWAEGLVEYWRETGHWGEFCRPLGHDDFECE